MNTEPRHPGRPPADPILKKNPVTVKLPQWLVEWTAGQPESRAVLIERAMRLVYRINPPRR
jgi:hypothetical protein